MSEKTGLDLLREPFPAHQISYIPKGGVKLAYVGHAALTDRLLDADPAWTWEPLHVIDGLPVFDGFGGMWIRLTVCGVTRLGYGHAGTKDGGDAIKEVIGDALRNAAMRFGAALDLWHKGDLHKEEVTNVTNDGSDPVLMQQLQDSIAQKTGARAAAAEDAGKYLADEVKSALRKLSGRVQSTFEQQGSGAAFDLLQGEGLNNEERQYLNGLLDDSKLRSALKRESQTRALANG